MGGMSDDDPRFADKSATNDFTPLFLDIGGMHIDFTDPAPGDPTITITLDSTGLIRIVVDDDSADWQ